MGGKPAGPRCLWTAPRASHRDGDRARLLGDVDAGTCSHIHRAFGSLGDIEAPDSAEAAGRLPPRRLLGPYPGPEVAPRGLLSRGGSLGSDFLAMALK